MDKLSVLREADRLGGRERSDLMNKIAVFARQNQCAVNATGGRGGTMQIRYGSLNLPVLDMTVDGVVTVYVRPSKNSEVSDELRDALTKGIESIQELDVKIAPRRASGKLSSLLEEVSEEALSQWVLVAINAIREHIYENPEV